MSLISKKLTLILMIEFDTHFFENGNRNSIQQRQEPELLL